MNVPSDDDDDDDDNLCFKYGITLVLLFWFHYIYGWFLAYQLLLLNFNLFVRCFLDFLRNQRQ